MMRPSIYKVIDEMNALEIKMDKLSDKAYDLYQAGKTTASDNYDRKADFVQHEIEGFRKCLKTLGLDAWRENTGKWHIPLDDIERVC